MQIVKLGTNKEKNSGKMGAQGNFEREQGPFPDPQKTLV